MTEGEDEFLELSPYLLTNVRRTATHAIGAGAYGSVVEVEIPGAVCAAKSVHRLYQDHLNVAAEDIQISGAQFVKECQLLSTLRHPHIVQFIGVCFLPGSRFPALVMERLFKSLHDELDPETAPQSPSQAPKPFFPLSLKQSILRNVACGLEFLHQRSPPIIHRDLSAKNILLDSSMVAKIADLGTARIVYSNMKLAAAMTKAPGAFVYMPPEALESATEENVSKYNMSIDIFSFGVVVIFTLSQRFPCNLLTATYRDEKGCVAGRSELERRDAYMQTIYRQLCKDHPFIQLIKGCLEFPENRLGIREVQDLLEQARSEIENDGFDVNKLQLIRDLQEKSVIVQQYQSHKVSVYCIHLYMSIDILQSMHLP